MRAEPIARREWRKATRVAFAAALGLMVPTHSWAQGEAAEELSGAEITARAEDSAIELAASLRAIEDSLGAGGPVGVGAQGLTREQNDQLVESAVKSELDGLTRELDDLSAALAVQGGDPEAAAALLESLSRRKARLLALAQSTQKPLLPGEELRALAERWRDLERLAAALGPAPAEAASPLP